MSAQPEPEIDWNDPTVREGYQKWQQEQKRLSDDMIRALVRYSDFLVKGFAAWFEEWKTLRMIR